MLSFIDNISLSLALSISNYAISSLQNYKKNLLLQKKTLYLRYYGVFEMKKSTKNEKKRKKLLLKEKNVLPLQTQIEIDF